MLAQRIVFTAPERVELQDFQVGPPSAEQVLVKTRASLISAGNETKVLLGVLESPATGMKGQFPAYPGYSNVGEIVEIGKAVRGYSVGDRVLTMGRHASHAIVNLGGARSDYMQRIPEGLSDRQAAFGIVGSVAMHGIRHAPIQLGDACVVIGQGVVGQILGQLALASGAYPVIGVDLIAERLPFSKQSGLHAVIDGAKQDSVQSVLDLTGGEGVPLALDATADPKTLNLLLKMAGLGGHIVIVGTHPGTVEISLWKELKFKELTIFGAWQPRAPMADHHYFPWNQSKNRSTILDLIAQRRLRVDHLVTHRPCAQEAPRIYDMIRRGGADWMAVVYDWT